MKSRARREPYSQKHLSLRRNWGASHGNTTGRGYRTVRNAVRNAAQCCLLTLSDRGGLRGLFARMSPDTAVQLANIAPDNRECEPFILHSDPDPIVRLPR